MNNKYLLETLERTGEWVSQSILELRELDVNEDKYTSQAIQELRDVILGKVQLTISEMEILSLELGGM